MKKLIFVILIAAIAWKLYARTNVIADTAPVRAVVPPPTIEQLVATNKQHFSCDGRLHCSQMTSCEEATYFLKNCPGVKMDGDHDGIPCEQQYCQ